LPEMVMGNMHSLMMCVRFRTNPLTLGALKSFPNSDLGGGAETEQNRQK
jgi:hypothetical protein